MSGGTHSAESLEDIISTRSQPRFQFITVSDPLSTKDAATKAIIRKHVMGEVGRARRLPQKRRKQLAVPLVMPPQDEWTCQPLPSNEARLDEVSAANGKKDLECVRHGSLLTYRSSHILGCTGSFHSLSRAEKKDDGIFGPFISTEALIGKLSWLGAGLLDPFTKYPFEMSRSDRALVAHSKWYCWCHAT